MSSSTSNIRAFIQWSEQAVFAGEELECRITFKNISPSNNASNSLPQAATLNGLASAGRRQRKFHVGESSFAPIKNSTPHSTHTGWSTRGNHRSTLSLNFPSSSGSQQRGGVVVGKGSTENWESGRERRFHRQSVSIFSLGLSDHGRHEPPTHLSVGDGMRRPAKGHARSSSLQIVTRRSVTNGIGPLSAAFPQRLTSHTSPLIDSFSDSNNQMFSPGIESGDRNALQNQSAVATSVLSTLSTSAKPSARNPSSPFSQNSKFPLSKLSSGQNSHNGVYDDEMYFPHGSHTSNKLPNLKMQQDVPPAKDRARPLTKTTSPMIHGETPRNSTEFYSLSNNSAETSASEYVSQQTGQNFQHQVHSRRISNHVDLDRQRTVETLMMGYAQVNGSFILDGSLVNQAPFEEVKRRAVLGGQGGGVVGVGSTRQDTGLLRGFGWTDIGHSIGELIRGGELSSIKDMRGTASSKSVPLLTTPQSILFVDLKLAPGESKSFGYAFRLPGGLPPSYRGKAIKISYNLVIGTQRPGGAMEQQVRLVEVPFRVLGSVNRHGQLLGHDFMSPYVLMRDQATTQCLDNSASSSAASLRTRKIPEKSDRSQSDLQDFRTYVGDLLARPRQCSSLGILSPIETRTARLQSSLGGAQSAKEAIDLAILRSNRATDSQQSANRFEIARNGQRVAVVILTRPAYRLGETINVAVDFAAADVSCYALHASLETSEKINSAIALRSNASIHRVTRRIYSSCSESTLFAPRMIFTCSIPSIATPTFITSGVCLEWSISLEFVTLKPDCLEQNSPACNIALLEEVSRDDRHMTYGAAKEIKCEAFDVVIPLQVYGASLGLEEYKGDWDSLVV